MRQSEERYISLLTDFGFKLFDAAAVARFTPTELREYEDSLKAYRDIKNSLDTAKEQGREEGMEEGLAKGREEGLAKGREEGLAKGREEGLAKGRAEGIALVAKMMYDKGMDVDAIASMIGMSKDEVERLCEQ